jgi:hypothetical protein
MCSKIAEWSVLAILLELSNLARHERLKPRLVLPKNGASSPHWWTFICTWQITQFDVSTKTHLHKNGASGTHCWTFKDNFSYHNQFWRPITFQSFPLGRRCSHLLIPLFVLPVSVIIWINGAELLLCGRTLQKTGYALVGYSLEQALVEPITTYHKGKVHK